MRSKMKYTQILIVIILAFSVSVATAQTNRGSDQKVSIDSKIHINEAVQILESYSVQQLQKKIINLSNYNGAINVPINNLSWDEALGLILLKNNLVRLDHVGYISIENIAQPIGQVAVEDKDVIAAKSKQVRIYAVAMLADRAYLQSLGIDWSTVFNGKVAIDAGFLGAGEVPSPIMSISGARDFIVGGSTIEISTLLKTIESNQKGNVIAKPNIMVSSGKKGYIQVGQDISVKTVDQAGNTMDTFFATGVIMDVTPTVVNIEGVDLINLTLSIERSSASPGNVSTVINKSKSNTELTLFNGEETVIGGLFDTDETRLRGGIPVLKDLPWWVLGMRYLFGYYKYEKKERELVIMLRATIVDSAVERSRTAARENR